MAGSSALAFDEAFLGRPLREQLALYAEAQRRLMPTVADAYDQLAGRLAAAKVGSSVGEIGQKFPSFVLPSDSGELVSSGELFARSVTVVSFNRGHWCPYCRLEITALNAARDRIRAAGGQIVSITPESADFIRTLKANTGASFLFLVDLDNAFALELGLAMHVDDTLRVLMEERGLDLTRYQRSPGWFLPVPATFVVNREGVILARFADPDFRKRMTIEDILSALAS